MEDHGVDCVLCLLSGYVYNMLLDSLVLVSCHAWVSLFAHNSQVRLGGRLLQSLDSDAIYDKLTI
jgi:hypothetical protein